MSKVRVGVADTGDAKIDNYLRPLREMGVEAHVLRWSDDDRDAEADVADYDGLILCGGGDVRAHYFGEIDHDKVSLNAEERDMYELELAFYAVRAERPLLAVCRGAQVLNIALGGSLDQHLPDSDHHLEHREGTVHEVEIEPGSILAGLGGAERMDVNHYHHQGIEVVGAGLEAIARTRDGVIEALEGPGPFCLGVQWHPERETGDAAFRDPLFEALVEAAKKAGQSRSPGASKG